MQQKMKPNYLAPEEQRPAIFTVARYALGAWPTDAFHQSKALQQRRDR
ncbi:MAG: hypothetical protein P8M25_11300 [Paracoccaceae bacterium]|nr:hypothetical protein [Paracoccaceae bacterium]